MAQLLKTLTKEGLMSPPSWMNDNIGYLTVMGSVSYGVSTDSSDQDIVGWAMPPKEDLFPNLKGYIAGFGPRPEPFNVWQKHHVMHNGTEYDFSIYSVASFLSLVCQNNPNMVDSMFTPERCVKHITEAGQLIRDNRRYFLSRQCYPKFRGYAYQQLKKIEARQPSNPERKEWVDKYGYDVKFGYHLVRLMLECEQILSEHDLVLDQNAQILLSVRRGEWSLERLQTWFQAKEAALETLHAKSTLRDQVDMTWAQNLLLNVVESHYGSVSEMQKVTRMSSEGALLEELKNMVAKYS